MASSTVAPGSTQQSIEVETKLPARHDEEGINNQIAAIHVTGDGGFDAQSLFLVVENILKHTAPIFGSFAPATQASLGNFEDMTPSAYFSSPSCILKQISCKMDGHALGEANAHETTLSILQMLSSYSWDARAVMTLAAFALGYGEFCFLMQIHVSDQLAKSLACLKRLPFLVEQKWLQKHQQALAELINLINIAIEVIKCIFEFGKLPNYGRENVPSLTESSEHIPMDVYWVIRTVVGCSAHMTGVTGNIGVLAVDLSSLAYNLDQILNKLRVQLKICKQQIEETETEAYQMLRNLLQINPTIAELFMVLCFGKSNVQPLIDGSTEVSFDVLMHKHVLLLISGPDISDNDLRTLKQLHKEIGNRGKIVWIPIVEQATVDMERRFWSRGSEVPLYIVQRFLPLPGIKFIKEEWHFTSEPIVVVINPKVRVEQCVSLAQIEGINSFPCFRKKRIDVLVDGICSCTGKYLCVHLRTYKCCCRYYQSRRNREVLGPIWED